LSTDLDKDVPIAEQNVIILIEDTSNKAPHVQIKNIHDYKHIAYIFILFFKPEWIYFLILIINSLATKVNFLKLYPILGDSIIK
jgi:hypothetical protein